MAKKKNLRYRNSFWPLPGIGYIHGIILGKGAFPGSNVGFTLVELLIVVAVVGVLGGLLLFTLNPAGQIAKTRDAQRRNDLKQIRDALDAYYSDKNSYPTAIGGKISGINWGDEWSSYMAKIPKDPLSGQDYRYESPVDGDVSAYRLYAKLERCSDFQNTIGVDCLSPDNYSIHSSNLSALALIPTPTLLPIATPTPTPVSAKRVFVSSSTYTGNLGGLSGADSKCQSLADGAGLSGAYKAWLSTIGTSVSSRLTHSGIPYKLVDGTLIANNWTDLIANKSGNYIANAISKDQNGNPVSGQYAWTNTKPDGSVNYSLSYAYTCLDWISSSGARRGFVGEISYTDVNWTQVLRNGGTYGTYSACSTPRYLYCFEQ